MDKIFNDDFVGTVKAKLDELCQDGAAVTRAKLCKELDMDDSMEHIVSSVVSLNLIPEYDMRKGRGIGQAGVTATKSTVKKNVSTPKLTDEFLTMLRATLEDILPEDYSCVSRDRIAEEMGDDSNKIKNQISAALKRDDFEDFETTVGRFGGVRRVLKEEILEDNDTDSDDNFIEEVKADSDDIYDDDADADAGDEEIIITDDDDIIPDINPVGPMAQRIKELRAQQEAAQD